MLIKDQLQALCEALGWTEINNITCVDSDDGLANFLPSFHNDLNLLANARNKLINSLELRIKWSNTLRTVVARRCKKNKIGTPLVSDIDLLFADAPELLETLLKTINKWKSVQ
jgi:hypothetical protein